jgi:hypothetical protein
MIKYELFFIVIGEEVIESNTIFIWSINDELSYFDLLMVYVHQFIRLDFSVFVENEFHMKGSAIILSIIWK